MTSPTYTMMQMNATYMLDLLQRCRKVLDEDGGHGGLTRELSRGIQAIKRGLEPVAPPIPRPDYTEDDIRDLEDDYQREIADGPFCQ